MRRRSTVVLVAWIGAHSAGAQAPIPVITLPSAQAATTVPLGAVLGVRQLTNGAVLVNDAGARQVRLFDHSLATSTIVIDSASGTTTSYGRRPTPFVPFLADTTLLPDYNSRTLVVLDPAGHIARSLALPTPNDIAFIRRGAQVDDKGRVYFASGNPTIRPVPPERFDRLGDSVMLLRADLAARRTDTLARIARPVGRTTAVSPDGGAIMMMWTVDPLRTIDDWAVLSDGSIAIVRGHDYHIDFIRSDGASASSAKLAFDWRRLTDDEKQRMVDSTRERMSQRMNDGSIVEDVEQINIVRGAAAGLGPPPSGGGGRGPGVPLSGGRSGASASPFGGFTIQPSDVTPADQLSDYFPPIRAGSVLADADDHLWILPTTSKQSQHGELVYDVVNTKGELFERVRVPLGRLVVGFGPGGVVYMTSGDRAHGYTLERSTLPHQ